MRKRIAHALLLCSAAASLACGATDIALVNPGFEAPANGPQAPGWVPTQHYGKERNFEWSVDTGSASEGKSSYRIKRLSEQAFGMIQQSVRVDAFAGKTVEFSAMLKADEVGPEGWLLVVNVENRNTILEQLRSEPVTGKQNWKRSVLRVRLPPDVFELKLGVMLLDAGTGWVDDVKLRVVD